MGELGIVFAIINKYSNQFIIIIYERLSGQLNNKFHTSYFKTPIVRINWGKRFIVSEENDERIWNEIEPIKAIINLW